MRRRIDRASHPRFVSSGNAGRLTLVDPVALSPWGSPFVQHVRKHEAAFSGLPEYIHEAIVPAYIRGAVRRSLSHDELAPYVRPWLGEVGQAAFYRQIAQMDLRYTDEVAPRYPEIRCPTLILHVTPASTARRRAAF